VRLALQRFAADTKIPMAEFLDIYGRFNQAIAEVGRANHILVIDLAREIPQEKQYMYDVVHLNAAGSRLAARVISEKLRPLIENKFGGGGQAPTATYNPSPKPPPPTP